MIVINKIQVVVKDNKYYQQPNYSKILIREFEKEVEEVETTLDNLPLFDSQEVEGVDEKGKQFTYKIRVPKIKKITKKLQENLNYIEVNIKDIKLEDNQIQDYFKNKSIINHNKMSFQVFEFDGATLQAVNQRHELENGQMVTYTTLRTFLM